jgi:flagellar M-ring protein FliF
MALRDVLSKVSIRSWAIIAVAAIGGTLFLTFLFQFASKPSYSTLLAGLNPTQTGKMTNELVTQGIPYQLQSDGTALAVPASDSSRARIALAGADLLSPTSSDNSLFTSGQLGESNSQEQVQYQIALEQQLSDTIDQVQGVNGSQVELALPNPDDAVFADSNSSASAAVLLSGGSELDAGAVRGIAQLVASSVQGLSLNKVTITSDTGEELWPNGASGGGDGELGLEDAEASYDQQQQGQLNAMLANTLGAGMATVVVNATLNENQSTTDALTYGTTGKSGIPLSTNTDAEKLTSKGGSSGTGATIPTTTGVTTGSGNSNYSNNTNNSTFGVNKVVTTTTTAPGTLTGESVSVLVSSKVPAAELTSITSAVQAAAGISAANLKTGTDALVVKQVKFPTTTATTPAAAAAPASGMMGMVKEALVGIGAVVFLFLITRMLRRRESEPLALRQATWLRELDSPRSLIELEDEAGSAEPVRVKRLRPAKSSTAKVQIEDLVEHEPDRVASQVREWMAED